MMFKFRSSGSALVLFFIALLGLSGCVENTPLQQSQLKYAGYWHSEKTQMLITENGYLEYKTKKDSINYSLSAPIKTIENNRLESGVWFFTSEFSLKGPYSKDGMTILEVDGEVLYQVNEESTQAL